MFTVIIVVNGIMLTRLIYSMLNGSALEQVTMESLRGKVSLDLVLRVTLTSMRCVIC